MDERLTMLEHAMWGVKGDNGVVTDLRELKLEVRAWRAEETARREADTEKARARDRALIFLAVTTSVGLLGIVATLLTVTAG